MFLSSFSSRKALGYAAFATLPSFYLVEILDPTELRSGGDAFKDYGFAMFIGGRVGAAHVTDVNLLDWTSW